MTLEEALTDKEFPDEIRSNLALISVRHVSFDSEIREGQLVVHTDVADETRDIFEQLFALRFPIHQIVPIVAFGWDDDVSMAANNSSAFNHRHIFGTQRLSNHSFGRAIDINPLQNPYIQLNGQVVPTGAQYDITQPGTITNKIAALFKAAGWKWGGDWMEPKDWQHFEKPDAAV